MKKPETYKELAEAEARKQVERIAAACPEFLGPLHSLQEYLDRKEKIQKRSGTVRSSWGGPKP
jgi:hypothetical protein